MKPLKRRPNIHTDSGNQTVGQVNLTCPEAATIPTQALLDLSKRDEEARKTVGPGVAPQTGPRPIARKAAKCDSGCPKIRAHPQAPAVFAQNPATKNAANPSHLHVRPGALLQKNSDSDHYFT